MSEILAKKLQLKPAQPVRVVNVPSDMLKHLAEELSGHALSSELTGGAEAVMVFVKGTADVNRLVPALMEMMKPGGLLWVAYPKLTSGVKTDISRDILWKLVEPSGWRPVRQISMDEVWTAMRFSPGKLGEKSG